MTITIVKGLVGRPVEKESTPASNSTNNNTQKVLQTASGAVSSDAAVLNLRSSQSGGADKSERLQTYSKAKKTSDDIAEKIRDNEDNEALGAHEGVAKVSSKDTVI